ncbi:MAG: hypothetical protein ACRDKJ_02680 [Actinomycetota bacterium]
MTAVIEDGLRLLVGRRTDPMRTTSPLPTFRGDGLQPGVDLDDNASLIEAMEADDRSL